MDAFEKKIRIKSVTRGLILGLITTVSSVLTFYFITGFKPEAISFIILPPLLSIVIPIFAVIIISFNLRAAIGGFWTFKQATSGLFIMFLTAYILHSLCYDLLFAKIIEPDLIPKTEVSAIAANQFLMVKQHQSQVKINQSAENIKKEFDQQKQNTAGKTILGMFASIILIFLFSLIFASLFKKDPPVYNLQEIQ